jgi:hypothetical protein
MSDLNIAKAVIGVLCNRGGFDGWRDNIEEFHDEILQEVAEQITKETP